MSDEMTEWLSFNYLTDYVIDWQDLASLFNWILNDNTSFKGYIFCTNVWLTDWLIFFYYLTDYVVDWQDLAWSFNS